jgi:hypothetical protein
VRTAVIAKAAAKIPLRIVSVPPWSGAFRQFRVAVGRRVIRIEKRRQAGFGELEK